jgi:hypothetical protein
MHRLWRLFGACVDTCSLTLILLYVLSFFQQSNNSNSNKLGQEISAEAMAELTTMMPRLMISGRDGTTGSVLATQPTRDMTATNKR